MAPDVSGGRGGRGGSLPPPRGPLSSAVLAALTGRAHPIGDDDRWAAAVGAADEEDLQLSLYCCYELHYGGFAGIDEEWEWEPTLLAHRRRMERRFERSLRLAAGVARGSGERPATGDPAAETVSELRRLASGGEGPSLSRWVQRHGERRHVVELAKHRSAYQLKEADPHTWAVPRLGGEAKATMVAIQSDEYGNGDPRAAHATLFSATMGALGLRAVPNHYLAELPAETLATVNAVSFFGLHRRLRAALVGHLALFEMTSVEPMGRYAAVLRRMGLPEEAVRFYDVHVEADALHQHLAEGGLVGGLLREEPGLAADVVFGARALAAVERRFSARLLGAWRSGRSSLHLPPPRRWTSGLACPARSRTSPREGAR